MPFSEDAKKTILEKEILEKEIHRFATFQRVFGGADGEFVMQELDRFSAYKSDTFNPDPYLSAYGQGRRAVAIFIHNMLEKNPEKYRKMLDAEGMAK